MPLSLRFDEALRYVASLHRDQNRKGTNTDVVPKPPWKERKRAYIARLRGASASVRLVSTADKLHNAATIIKDIRLIGDKIWERFNAGKEESLWYYRSLVAALREAGSHPLVDELDRVVTELEGLEL